MNLVEVGAGEVDEASRLGPLGIVEEIEAILPVLVLQHKVKTLPLLVLLALLEQVALKPGVHRLFDARLLATLPERGVDLLRIGRDVAQGKARWQ